LNQPGLGAGIDHGMALTPLPSSIGWDQTHDLPIVGRVLYRWTIAFAIITTKLVLRSRVEIHKTS